MKRIGGCFETITSPENLWAAWLDFRRGKRRRPTVARFEPNAIRHVHRLHRALTAGSYRPEGYRVKIIREPKHRLIAVAPVRDRIVHHAIHRQLAEPIDRRLVSTTFACLPGRGSHRAVLAFQRALRRYRYVLMLDIAGYFANIHGPTLLTILTRYIKDRPVLALCERIIHSGIALYQRPDVRRHLANSASDQCGLPIGNLTSQWWANHYLSGFDHAVKRTMKAPYSQRYMDDMSVFGQDSQQLEDIRAWAQKWLADNRGLQLKDNIAPVRSARGAFTYLGYRITRQDIRATAAHVHRAQVRLFALTESGQLDKVDRSLDSYRGSLSFPATQRTTRTDHRR